MFDYIRKQTLPDGTTGRVAFDEMGDRIYAEYQVVNVQSSSKEKRVVVGHYKYSNVSKITVMGGFQLLDLIIPELKSHVIPHKFKCSHWWKIHL